MSCQYLPTPEQLAKLKEHVSEYDSLAEAEQFAISLADIKRYIWDIFAKTFCNVFIYLGWFLAWSPWGSSFTSPS